MFKFSPKVDMKHGLSISSKVKYILAALFLAMVVSCSKEPVEPVEFVAKIGDRVITLEDFRRFYEYDPNFGVDSTGSGALQAQLDRQIDYVLADHKARKSGLADSASFVKAREWELQQAMLRQLYRDVVQEEVTIGDAMLREAFREYNTEVRVRHLFSLEYRDILRWQDSLANGVPFERLAYQSFRDSALAANGGDLGWQKTGDLEPEIAELALRLSPKTVSAPVKTRFGYHLVEVLDRREPLMLTETAFESQRPSLEKRLRRKQEAVLANRFIHDYIGGINPQPVEQGFRLLWNALVRDAGGERSRPRLHNAMSDEQLAIAAMSLSGQLDAPLVRYNGGVITVGEYLQGLRSMPAGERPRFQSPRQLSDRLGIWVRNRFLAEKARAAGLEKHPRVQQELGDFLRELAYFFYLQREAVAVEPPPAVRAYFAGGRKRADLPEAYADAAGFHTLEAWRWQQATARLHAQLRRENTLPIIIDREKLLQENQHIDWKNRVRMFMFRKPS